jgi:hypothetical protein
MKLVKLFCIALCLFQLTSNAEILDNFSKKDWVLSRSTPGELTIENNVLSLTDKVDKQDWVTASKTFSVDIEKTPILVIKIISLSAKGQVKLIRVKPFSKKSVFIVTKPGIYTYNMKKSTKWTGKQKIQVYLYALGKDAKISYGYVKFTDKLNKEDLKVKK